MSGAQAPVALENVSFRYDGRWILEEVTLEIAEREFLGLIGPNGSGKSTLLKLILGLRRPQKGRVLVYGNRPEEARGWIGYVPQHLSFDRSFPVTAMDVVLMGRLGVNRGLRRYGRADRTAAEEVLEQVGVAALGKRAIGTLSGGELQRVFIARALVSKPRLLILDEPTTGVDIDTEKAVYELLKELNQKMTIILVTHELNFVSAYVKRVACLARRLVCHPTDEVPESLYGSLYLTPIKMVRHEHEEGV
ncbi:MAG: ABC transporter ATP-binding protein [bacterium]